MEGYVAGDLIRGVIGASRPGRACRSLSHRHAVGLPFGRFLFARPRGEVAPQTLTGC